MGSGQSTPQQNSSNSSSSNTVSVGSIPVTPYTVNTTTSKKYALVIGINYTGTNFSLSGCINDANNIKNQLNEWGFETTLMTDNTGGNLYPTMANILSQITSHISRLSSGDILVIYYSGHGSRVTDNNGDEISGLDSCIVPINVSSVGYIVDDEIRTKLTAAVPGSNIFAAFDSCNSGSVCDLRYCYFDTSYRGSLEQSITSLSNTDFISRTNYITNTKYNDTSANIISLSGSRDDELSFEFVNENGVSGGALTYCILWTLRTQTPNISIATFLLNVRSKLKTLGFGQNPSLMSGRTLNTDDLLNGFLKV